MPDIKVAVTAAMSTVIFREPKVISRIPFGVRQNVTGAVLMLIQQIQFMAHQKRPSYDSYSTHGGDKDLRVAMPLTIFHSTMRQPRLRRHVSHLASLELV